MCYQYIIAAYLIKLHHSSNIKKYLRYFVYTSLSLFYNVIFKSFCMPLYSCTFSQFCLSRTFFVPLSRQSAYDFFFLPMSSISRRHFESQKVSRDWRPFPDSIFVIKTHRISSAYAWGKSRSDDHSPGPFEILVARQSRRGIRKSFDGIVRYAPLGYTLMSPFDEKENSPGRLYCCSFLFEGKKELMRIWHKNLRYRLYVLVLWKF